MAFWGPVRCWALLERARHPLHFCNLYNAMRADCSGAGKTTLLRYLLENSTEKVACIVNDVASINIDAKLVRNDRNRARGEAINTTTDLADTIELANGCACACYNSAHTEIALREGQSPLHSALRRVCRGTRRLLLLSCLSPTPSPPLSPQQCRLQPAGRAVCLI